MGRSPFPRRPLAEKRARGVSNANASVVVADFAAQPRPVIARLPATLTEGVALEVLFRGGDQVDVRSADGGSWTPLRICGGDVEVRVR